MPPSLTKAHVVDSVVHEIGITRKQSIETVEVLLEVMKRALESGEDILISDFGKFCVRQKKERKGRNPAIGEDLMLEPRKVVTFLCSGKLRAGINNGK